MFAAMATGAAKFTCCQPDADSPVKVAVASLVPVLNARLPTLRTGVACVLVESDAGDRAGHIGLELDAELDGAVWTSIDQARHGSGRPDAVHLDAGHGDVERLHHSCVPGLNCR